MSRLQRVLERQQLTASASRVRPVFGKVRSECLQGPRLARPSGERLRVVQEILEHAYGYTETDRDRQRRRAPSAGARYPTEVVCVAFVAGRWVALGYDFRRHGFRELPAADPSAIAAIAALTRDQVAIVVTSTLWRTLQRYGFRGHRYCLIDAGVVLANLAEVCRALRLPAATPSDPVVARIDERLALPSAETALTALIVDCAEHTAPAHPGAVDELILDAAEADGWGWAQAPMLAAELERTIALDRSLRSAATAPPAPMPARTVAADDVLGVLSRRRSAQGFARASVRVEEVTALRDAVRGVVTQWPATITRHLAIGIAVRDSGHLSHLAADDDSEFSCATTAFGDISDASIIRMFGNQPLMADADVFVFAGLRPGEDAFDAYRPTLLQAGILAEALSLLAVELGVGHTIVGGFDDPAVAALFGGVVHPLVALAFGHPTTHRTKNDTPGSPRSGEQ